MPKGRGHFKARAKSKLHVAGELPGRLRVWHSDKEKPAHVRSDSVWTNAPLNSVFGRKSAFENHGKSTTIHRLAWFIGTMTYATILNVF